MVRTSTAERYNYRCPACGDDLRQDTSGRGWVKHVSNPNCRFEKGQKDCAGAPYRTRRLARPAIAEHKPADGLRVCGYSERGIFNALLYEIGYSANPLGELAGLLALIRVPGETLDFADISGAEVLIEQSLSDFGDADAILLLHGPDWKRVVFIEGKVKPSQRGSWTVQSAWREFLGRKKGKLDSSNLFTQLYHKVRFLEALRVSGIRQLVQGIPFPDSSGKSPRLLGSNRVVLRAARMIKSYSEKALYIAVVPDSARNLGDFFDNELQTGPGSDVTGWSTTGWGYLTWEEVEDYCEQRGLTNTRRVFDFNRGQIY